MSDVTPTFNARATQTARDASVQSKAERVTQFAERTFERCERQWTNQFYDRLLKREGNAPTLQPSWAWGSRDFPSKNDKVLWRPRRPWPPEGYYFSLTGKYPSIERISSSSSGNFSLNSKW
jgi:hypothetical protein